MALDFGLLNTNAPAQIAGAYGRGQQEAQANLLAEQQLQHAQNQNALSKYQIDAARMQNEQQNALNTKYSGGGFDPMSNDTHLKELYGMGAPGRAQAGEILKYRADQRKAEESAVGTAIKRHGVYQKSMGALATEADLTKDTVSATLDKLVANKIFSQAARDTIVQNLPDDPAALRASVMQDAKANLTGKDQLTAFLPEIMVAGGNLVNKNPLAPGGAGAVVAPVAPTAFETARIPMLQQTANAATTSANAAAANAATARQRLQQETATGELTPQTLDFAAETYRQTGLMPITGMGKNAASLRTQILNRATELASGMPAAEAAAAVAANKQDIGSRTKAVKDFSTGKQGQQVNAFNTAIDHLGTMSKLTDALQNNDIKAFNALGNTVARQTGQPAPTDFNAAKQIVTAEVIKAVVASGGGVTERQEAERNFADANSPQQLKGIINTYKQLLGGQLNSLNLQYENTTGRKDFSTKLTPEAKNTVAKLRGETTTTGALAPADQEAMNWANANPTDPRAAQIKQKLGR